MLTYEFEGVAGRKKRFVVPSPHWTVAPSMLMPRKLTVCAIRRVFRAGSLSAGPEFPGLSA